MYNANTIDELDERLTHQPYTAVDRVERELAEAGFSTKTRAATKKSKPKATKKATPKVAPKAKKQEPKAEPTLRTKARVRLSLEFDGPMPSDLKEQIARLLNASLERVADTRVTRVREVENV